MGLRSVVLGVVAAVAIAGCGAADGAGSDRSTAPTPSDGRDDHRGGSDPSTIAPHDEPIFDDVTPLTPVSLPEGWRRCSAGPSSIDDAGADWWSQGFGPVVDGACRTLVTVTQVPPDVQYGEAVGDVIKVGTHDAAHWWEPERGAEWLFLWAFTQNLIVEACCEQAATVELFNVAEQAYEGLHIDEPARCTGDEHDISREDTGTQLSGADSRMYSIEGCPTRLDIVALGYAPDDDHCFPNVGSVSIGTPTGVSKTASRQRHYYRDPADLLGRPEARARLDLDAELPQTATDSGYRQGDLQLWIDTNDETLIYIVKPDVIEAWPLIEGDFFCA